MTLPLTIQVSDPRDLVPVGEFVPLRMIVALDDSAPFKVIIPAGGVRHLRAAVSTEMLLRDVTLSPGDTVSVTVGFRFDTPGPQNLRDFAVQVNPVGRPDKERGFMPLPDHPFRAVPSLDAALSLELTRICAYGEAVKVEVVLQNQSTVELRELELQFGPVEVLRSGPLVRREGRLPAGGGASFELIVAGGEVECYAAATIAGERVESRWVRRIPGEATSSSESQAHFSFLEPRALTTDRLTLMPEGGGSEAILTNGVFPVRGGKSRYVVTVHPSHPQASSVRLYAAAGQVEVEAHAKSGRQWPFLITIVDNPMFTQLVRLDYDVQVHGAPLRGEFHLSIRPSKFRVWTFAATLGLAITLKGAASVGPVMFRGDGGLEFAFENLAELFERRWIDGLQALSIPIIWTGLWAADRIWRPLQEG